MEMVLGNGVRGEVRGGWGGGGCFDTPGLISCSSKEQENKDLKDPAEAKNVGMVLL